MKNYSETTYKFHYTAPVGTGDINNPVGENDNLASVISSKLFSSDKLILTRLELASAVHIDCYHITFSTDTPVLVANIMITEQELYKNHKTLLELANDTRNTTLYPDPFMHLIYVPRFVTTPIPYPSPTEVFTILMGYERVEEHNAEVQYYINIINNANLNSSAIITDAVNAINNLLQ